MLASKSLMPISLWLYLRAHYAHWRRSGRSDSPHRLEGWRNRLRRVMFRRGVEPGQGGFLTG